MKQSPASNEPQLASSGDRGVASFPANWACRATGQTLPRKGKFPNDVPERVPWEETQRSDQNYNVECQEYEDVHFYLLKKMYSKCTYFRECPRFPGLNPPPNRVSVSGSR